MGRSLAVAGLGAVVLLGAAAGANGFTLRSAAFAPGASIPVRYTCDGRNVSPPLSWTAPPKATRSFALVMDDPDATRGTFTHWLAWNIPARSRSLPSGRRAPREGRNDAGSLGYVGPCPPSGMHRYVFRLYALRAPLALPSGATRTELLSALRGRSMVVARLVARYGR